MTVTDRLKIIDNKIKVNQAQCDLDRLTAKTSVCFSGDLRKYQSDFNYDSKFAFHDFYRGLKKFKRMSLDSEYDEINDFYALLNVFINTHEATATETKK